MTLHSIHITLTVILFALWIDVMHKHVNQYTPLGTILMGIWDPFLLIIHIAGMTV